MEHYRKKLEARKKVVSATQYVVLFGVFFYWFSRNGANVSSLAGLLGLGTGRDVKSLLELRSLYSLAMFVVTNKSAVDMVIAAFKELGSALTGEQQDFYRAFLAFAPLFKKYVPQVIRALALNMLKVKRSGGGGQGPLGAVVGYGIPFVLFVLSNLTRVAARGQKEFSNEDIATATIKAIEPFLGSLTLINADFLKQKSGVAALGLPSFVTDMVFSQLSNFLYSFMEKQALQLLSGNIDKTRKKIEDYGIDLWAERVSQLYVDTAVAQVMQNQFGLQLSAPNTLNKFEIWVSALMIHLPTGSVEKGLGAVAGAVKNMLAWSAKGSGLPSLRRWGSRQSPQREEKKKEEECHDYIWLRNKDGVRGEMIRADAKDRTTTQKVVAHVLQKGLGAGDPATNAVVELMKKPTAKLDQDLLANSAALLVMLQSPGLPQETVVAVLRKQWSPLQKALALYLIKKYGAGNPDRLVRMWERVTSRMRGEYVWGCAPGEKSKVARFLYQVLRRGEASIPRAKLPGFLQEMLTRNGYEVTFLEKEELLHFKKKKSPVV